jgi:hypothetical protein
MTDGPGQGVRIDTAASPEAPEDPDIQPAGRSSQGAAADRFKGWRFCPG